MSVGLRTAWALPIGSLDKGESMRSHFDYMIVPVWLDVGYRLSRQLYIGGYLQWGILSVADEVCTKNLLCGASDTRLGVNARWHFKWIVERTSAVGPFDPWIGVGTGYESATIRLRTVAGAVSRDIEHGFEILNVQLGGDYVAGLWRLGGFASLAVAEYTRRTLSTPTGSPGFDIPHPAAHLWLSFGMRFQYDL